MTGENSTARQRRRDAKNLVRNVQNIQYGDLHDERRVAETPHVRTVRPIVNEGKIITINCRGTYYIHQRPGPSQKLSRSNFGDDRQDPLMRCQKINIAAILNNPNNEGARTNVAYHSQKEQMDSSQDFNRCWHPSDFQKHHVKMNRWRF